MTVLSIIITESKQQVVSGIPKSVCINTNIHSNIYYTLDGTTPTQYSTNYTGDIYLPYNVQCVILSVLAVSGSISASLVETYITDAVDGNVRLPHAATTARPGALLPNTFPYGSPGYQVNQKFLNPADASVTVYNQDCPAAANMADGNVTYSDQAITVGGNTFYPPLQILNDGYTNEPYNSCNYQITYSTSDKEGETGPNKGNVPTETAVMYPAAIPEQSNEFTMTFDPRALVIFQDFRNQNPEDPVQVNRQFFSLEDPNKARDGVYYYNTGQDATAPPSGSFISAHYNPTTNTDTYYYRDSWSNRWIISTSEHIPSPNAFDNNLSQMPVGRNPHVYEWLTFTRRVLF
jgi:hypothetical protein